MRTDGAAAPVVFAYDFPHRKTQDVILRLVSMGRPPAVVIAAPPVALRVPPPSVRVKARHVDLLDPEELCRKLGVEYVVCDHNGDDCRMVLDERRPGIGIIAGARILSRHIIECFGSGVLNFHPGVLPEVRGLDALQWALYEERPLGVTAHLIDERVDAGWIVDRCIIDEYPDDTLVDLSLRLYETQLAMLPSSLARAVGLSKPALRQVTGTRYNRSFPAELVPEMRRRFAERRIRLATGHGVAPEPAPEAGATAA